MQHLKSLKVFPVILSLLSGCLFEAARGQDVHSVSRIANEHQACLDAGVRMRNCSERYFLRMDSLLRAVIKTKSSGLGPGSALQFKTAQANWEARKVAFFKKEDERFMALQRKGIWGRDNIMEIYSEKGDFIKKRILVLLSQK